MCAAQPQPSIQHGSYQRRQPETACLHGIVTRKLSACLTAAQTKSASGYGYPSFVEREFRKYLDCGNLKNGFVRVTCDDCPKETLVAFSCKGRGICPSCTARRMSNTAAHLVDKVFPNGVPYRQWVISFPRRVRFLLAQSNALLSAVLNTALKKIFAWQKRCARRLHINEPQCGAVTFVQRFGSLVNLNVHAHCILPDGVFSQCHREGTVNFHPIPPPSRADIERLLKQIAVATEKLIYKHGVNETQDNEPPNQLVIEQAQSLKFDSIATTASISQAPKIQRCAFLQGYSLHAERIIDSDDRDGLERLCRYGARAPIANSRLSLDDKGNAIIKLKRPYYDGRTQLQFTQLELLQKLAILIPPPRKNLTRYHGVFGPNHHLRAAIVNIGRPDIVGDGSEPKPARSLPWAMLLRRVFAIDMFQCADCGGRQKIIAVIPASDASQAILEHLERTTPKAQATGPPTA